ncbi:uncharacterized protein LOC143470246 isoform X3 [Clavelina lepadiformis]|uniref:uncharacterized protein LOC143450751 isoform X3 n=1 Tax=Clavelina lepadiformis TaxID=159417 RepID=UPI004041F6CA
MLLGKAMAFESYWKNLETYVGREAIHLCHHLWYSKQPSSLGFLQLHWQIQNGQKRATEAIRQHLEKEESEWEYGLLKQIEEKFRNVYQFDYNTI